MSKLISQAASSFWSFSWPRMSLWVLLLSLAPALVFGQKTLPKPSGFLINDYAGLLSREQTVQLGNKLSAYARETSTQIVVITEASLEGEEIFDYTIRLAEEWGIGGDKDKDNGILVYVAAQDRKVRIQTGYGAEGFLPDVISKRIIENIISPAFKEGNYYEGLDKATSAIMDLGRGEYTQETGKKKADQLSFWIILLFIVVIVAVIAIFSRRKGGGKDDDDDDGGYHRDGRYDMDRYSKKPRSRGVQQQRQRGGWMIFPFPIGGWGGGGSGGGGNSGDGWGGFGGGDFGGFGGGDFGGGGAGGSW